MRLPMLRTSAFSSVFATGLATLSALLLASTLASSSLSAQRAPASAKPIRIVISGGMTLPAGDLADFQKAGPHVDASVLVRLAGLPLTLRPELSYARFQPKDLLVTNPNGTVPPPAITDSVTKMLGALGNIELPLAGGLYVLGGVGALNLNAADESQTKLTINAGAGLRFHIGRSEGFVEARIGSASYNAGKFGYSSAQYIPVTFGLAF